MEQFFSDLLDALDAQDTERAKEIVQAGREAWQQYQAQHLQYRRKLLLIASPSENVNYNSHESPDIQRSRKYKEALRQLRRNI